LARAGIRAVIFDYVGGPSDDDVLAIGRQGVRRVAFVGASTGGPGRPARRRKSSQSG
jgi:hypothetical protein